MAGLLNSESASMLQPHGYDKHGPYYKSGEVTKLVFGLIKADSYFNNRAKVMSKDLDNATKLVDQSIVSLDAAVVKLVNTENKVAESTKKVSGLVRASTQKLSEGLAKIEKQANFDRLERYVELLERANVALTSLGELEKSGKLERIAGAIR
jgi:hypothetical protein